MDHSVEAEQAGTTFEVLEAHHDRSSFDCGEPSLNIFLQRQARQNIVRNLGMTHVMVPAPGAATILGYYTLLTRSIERSALPKFNQFPVEGVGVVLLGRLAVDYRAQGHGYGTGMLLLAIEQTESAARNIGIHALVVSALNDRARDWYLNLHFGFQEMLSSPHHLYLPIATIRASGLIEKKPA